MAKGSGMFIPLSFAIIVAAGFAILLLVIKQNQETSNDNNAYIRFVACTLSVPPAERDQPAIDECWRKVEKDTNRSVMHY